MVTYESNSPEETQALGHSIAAELSGPVCLALFGDLGAGKTTLVRGLVGGWGGDISQVSSPTYVLLNCYATPRGPIFHLDAYRVQGPEDLEAIGFDELWSQAGMIIVEWPERVRTLLPSNTIQFSITSINEHCRAFTKSAAGQ